MRLDGELRAQLGSLEAGEVQFDEALANWTAFGCGGPADALVQVADLQGWGRVLSWCREAKVPVTTVGQGRGMAVRGGGLLGVVVVTSMLTRIGRVDQRDDLDMPPGAHEGDLVVETGLRMGDLSSILAAQGVELTLNGPGTLGGTVRRCWPVMRGQLYAVGVLGDRGKIRWRDAADLDADTFPVKQRQGIAAALLRLPNMPSATLFAGSDGPVARDPIGTPDWIDGKLRLFLDTPDSKASDVLDSLNVRGIRLRSVAIDEADPNVAVNLGGGTIQDLGLLVKYLVERAEKEAGTTLGQAYRVSGKKRRP